MCSIDKGIFTAKEDFKVYKVVKKGTRGSLTAPQDRHWITARTRGTILTYNKDKTVNSPTGPGVMAFRTRYDARVCKSCSNDATIIQLLIKKGTKYHTGKYEDMDIIAAKSVKVLT